MDVMLDCRTQRVTTMMMTHPSKFAAPNASLEGAPMLWRVSTRGLFHDGSSEQSQVSSDLATALPVRDLCDKTVEISPIDSVKRHSVARHGLVVESIYAPVRSRITVHYGGPHSGSHGGHQRR